MLAGRGVAHAKIEPDAMAPVVNIRPNVKLVLKIPRLDDVRQVARLVRCIKDQVAGVARRTLYMYIYIYI